MPGEFDFIPWVRRQQSASETVKLPAGDDLAILKWSANDLLLVGVDQALDGVHFDSSVHEPQAIGRKAMNRNLSDCAAMACLPAAAVIAFTLPRGIGIDYAQQLYQGIRQAGDKFNCPIIGGDTGSWNGKLAITVTILGKSDGIEPVRRSGAKVGDLLYVTGPLGGSIQARHMIFEPRIELARHLAKNFHITSMIDLSDGLSRDLPHICKAGAVGAVMNANAVPIHPDVHKTPDHTDPLSHALNDGEDYELLFTSPDRIPTDLATPIGQITGGNAVEIETGNGQRSPLQAKGWEHPL
jgi:thiamine-monophosphate kinase